MAPLYAKNIKAQKGAMSGLSLTPDQYKDFGNVEGKGFGAAIDGGSNLDFEAIGNMTNRQFRQFKGGLTNQQRNMLFFK